MDKLFTLSDAWVGGEYELALELGDRSDARLREALASIWVSPTLEGCYRERDLEPWDQPRIEPTDTDLPLEGVLCGIATMPNGVWVACRSVPVREEEGTDWLYFGVPMGSLIRAFPVGAFPFEDGSLLDWRDSVDSWLHSIAEAVYIAVPFRLGLVGCIDLAHASSQDVAQNGIPAERWESYLWPEKGKLQWYPANKGASFTFP